MFIENVINALLVPTNHAEYHTRPLPRAFGVDLVGTISVITKHNICENIKNNRLTGTNR